MGSQKQAQAALMHSEQAIELSPEEPTSHLARGMALLMSETGQSPTYVSTPEAAIDALTAAFELRDKGALDSAYPDKWPATLEAHAHHLLGKLIATHPPEPERNTRLHDAVVHFTKAAQL